MTFCFIGIVTLEKPGKCKIEICSHKYNKSGAFFLPVFQMVIPPYIRSSFAEYIFSVGHMRTNIETNVQMQKDSELNTFSAF
jgi:hypothetical protein